jgi:hypothetical protein
MVVFDFDIIHVSLGFNNNHVSLDFGVVGAGQNGHCDGLGHPGEMKVGKKRRCPCTSQHCSAFSFIILRRTFPVVDGCQVR